MYPEEYCMKWGRKRTTHPPAGQNAEISRFAQMIIITGALICIIFFASASSGTGTDPTYPAAMAEAARNAFLREHTVLASVLGIDTYFPEEAVYTGTFGIAEAGERWSFTQYLRDAFHVLLRGENP